MVYVKNIPRRQYFLILDCFMYSFVTNDIVSENAKWFLNVSWQMEGVDIHLDVNVGKQLSALGHTLTMLTGKYSIGTLLKCLMKSK